MVADAPEVRSDPERPGLESLLQHPAIWRGRSAAQVDVVSSGHPQLDEALPGGGWPRAGLIEILTEHRGVGELQVLLPALARLTQFSSARWLTWVDPPFEPFAPALAAQGMVLGRVFVARTSEPMWVFEQSLASGACESVLAWVSRLPARDIRRLQLAAEKGRALGVLFRPHSAAKESSSAVLRVVVEPAWDGARVTLLKSRGGRRGSVDLQWNLPSQGCVGPGRSQEGVLKSSPPQRTETRAGSW
jgi:hypothetical protein